MNCYKGDGTLQRGERIIATLENQGGKNIYKWEGKDEYGYYFIKGGAIVVTPAMPKGYKLSEPK